jgi:O-antigen/teichoic acid export membrane protein
MWQNARHGRKDKIDAGSFCLGGAAKLRNQPCMERSRRTPAPQGVGSAGRMIRKVSALFSINALLLALLLVRNVLIARLVGVENFGIATTFALVIAAMELASALGGDRFIVQDRDGDNPAVLDVIHTLSAARSVLVAILIWFQAPAIAGVFGMPDLAWTYQVLAIVPLLRALQNYDVYRQHRTSVFWKSSYVELIGVVVGILAIVPALWWFGDYRLMLVSLLVQYLVQSLMSHTVSARPFRFGLNGAIARRWFGFSWPITLNNLLMFALMHGDRFIIGAFVGIRQLGWFSAAQASTMAPTLILMRTLGSVLLASLSRKQDDDAAFGRLAGLNEKLFITISMLVGLGLFAVGDHLFLLLFGRDFEGALAVFSILVAFGCLRLARGAMLVVSQSRSQSANDLLANLPRLIMLPLVALAAYSGWSLPHVLLVALLGEALGLGISGWLLHRSLPSPAVGLWALRAVGFAFVVTLVVDSVVRPGSVDWSAARIMALCLLAFLSSIAIWLSRDLRNIGKAL